MPASDQLEKLLDRMPDPDERSMYTTDIDKERIEAAIAEMLTDGRESMLQLIDLLGEPGTEEDVKPRYAAHCLVNHALVVKDEQARRELSETIAGELGSGRPRHVTAFLCQLLQWAGRREATPALGELLLDDELVEPATMALTAIQDGAAQQFRTALAQAQGKCRVNVVQGLAATGEPADAAALREALEDDDPEVRLAVGWGLARLGDADSVAALLRAADAQSGWERIQATQHCLVLAEKLAADGNASAARRVYEHLRTTRRDGAEQYIREAAERGIAALSL